MTLQEHIDALDKMVADHALTHEIRSQIAFIGREVAVLEADCQRLAQLDAEHNAFVQASRDAGWAEIQKQADAHRRMLRNHELNYNV